MIASTFVRTRNDSNGNPQRAWLVCHVAGDQVTYLGALLVADEPNWSRIRQVMPGIVQTASVDVTPSQYRDLKRDRTSPEHMRKVADALEGS